MKRKELQSGFVLHSRPYRETSLLVEYFSREQGRVSLVAKGAKGRKTRGGNAAALLQPFTPLACSWSGSSELKTLTGCEAEGPAVRLLGTRLYSGLYINELLVRLLHHEDPHETLFDEYCRVLSALTGEEEEELVLRRFEFALLDELGYGFDPGLDGMSGEPVVGDSWYHYHQEYGMVLAQVSSRETTEPGSGSNERIPRYHGAELQLLEQGDLSGAGRRCAKRLMRQVLGSHLGDKPLKSRELFRTLS